MKYKSKITLNLSLNLNFRFKVVNRCTDIRSYPKTDFVNLGRAPWSCGLMHHVLDREVGGFESGRGTIDLPKHIKFSLFSGK